MRITLTTQLQPVYDLTARIMTAERPAQQDFQEFVDLATRLSPQLFFEQRDSPTQNTTLEKYTLTRSRENDIVTYALSVAGVDEETIKTKKGYGIRVQNGTILDVVRHRNVPIFWGLCYLRKSTPYQP